MAYSGPAGQEEKADIQMLGLYDLDIAELEARMEVASVLAIDCWTDGPTCSCPNHNCTTLCAADICAGLC